MIRFTQFALLICLLSAAPSKAALVLSLDAREPGPDPTNSWQDLSGTNSPFTANSNFDGTGGLGDVNAGSAPMLVNDPNSVGAFYDFNNAADTTGPAFFASSVGDNDNFDFDTAKGTSTDPFTVVLYGKAQGGSTDGVINKGRNSTNGVWFVDIQNNNNAELVQQPNNGGARNFGRWNGLTSSDEDFHLYVFHADGSGDASNSRLYYDGATAESHAVHPINGLGESILNDTELHIGAMENFGAVNDFDGGIQFIEIYTGSTVDNNVVSGMSPSDYSTWRIGNLGTVIGSTGPPPAPARVFQWNKDFLGDWATQSNWNPIDSVNVPLTKANNGNHTVIFPDDAAITGSTNVNTAAAVSVNRIQFEHPTHSFVVSGVGSVNLHATTDPNTPVNPSMSATGTHQFQAVVNLHADTTIDVNSASTLSMNNAVNLSGVTLTKTGTGTLEINNALNTGGGTVVGQAGAIGGSGTVGGNLSNPAGTVAPGNSPGVLSVNGNYTQGSGGTLEIEVTGTSPGESGHDQLSVTGAASLDGTLDIVPQAPYADPSVRGTSENMVILTAGTVTGTFSTVNYDGNALTADFGPDANGSIRDHVGSGLFRSVIYSDSNVTVQNLLALEGDTDGDKDVDITDFNSLSTNFDPGGNNSATNDWIHADFDLDGDIDITDFNALSANFAPGGYAASSPGQIPEPSAVVLVLIGLSGLMVTMQRSRN